MLGQKFIRENGEFVEELTLTRINKKTRRYQDYLQWLAALVDRINGIHHPKFPGK